MSSEEEPVEYDDLVYLARIGELDELKECANQLSTRDGLLAYEIFLSKARDEYSGNTCAHMAAGNGHLKILQYLAEFSTPNSAQTRPSAPTAPTATATYKPRPPPHPLLNILNENSKSTPLHYACTNGHLECVQFLIHEGGADPYLKNAAGRDSAFEAEAAQKWEVMGWILAEYPAEGEEEQAQDEDDKETGESSSAGADAGLERTRKQ